MKKNIYKKSLLLFSLIISISTLGQGILTTDGTQIVDEDGNEVIWRGIGLGGWMLQEGYMLGTTGPQHELEARIEELVGEEKKEQFYEAWLANHMQEIDIDSMSAWGYNMIRLPMHYKLFTPPIEEEPVPGEITWLDKGFEMTDALLEWCKTHNIYLILDLHAAPGGQGENADISDYDPSKPPLWESEANQQKTIALWRKLAERYADEPNIAAYDLINEPNWGFENHEADPNGCSESQNTLLWQLQQDITSAIREVDENHIIVIEGNCWGNNYSGLPTLWDDNLVISYHKYWNSNDPSSIQGMLNMRSDRKVPIWLGESGENANTWFTNAISLLENNDIGWSWWPLKKLGSNNPLQVKRNPGYQDILDYWNGSSTKPSETAAFEALMQLAENLKLENNIYHKDVVDAMIRQPHTDEIIPFKEHTITQDADNIIYAVDYDLGKVGYAYFDNVSSNTTGNAGGETWNNGHAYRNDGVDIEACEDETTNGYNVGWTQDGEWLKYTVEIEEEGSYSFMVRTASSGPGGAVSLYVDEVRTTERISLPNTGDYGTWETTTVNEVYLPSGTHVIKLFIDQGGFNLNYFQFSGPQVSSGQPQLLEKEATHQKKKIGLIYNQAFEEIPADHGFTVTVNGMAAEVTDVALRENVPQAIEIMLAEPLYYNDEVIVGYSGTGVMTKPGVILDHFSDVQVEVGLDGGIVPLPIPGRVQVEDFTTNNGFELEETEDTGGGENVGYTDNGDYLDFTAEVMQTGYYEVKYRVSSQDTGGSLRLMSISGSGSSTGLSEVQFDATGGWQSWATVTGTDAYLEKGLTTLRLQATASLFNINWFELEFIAEDLPTGTEDLITNSNLAVVYPNPNDGTFQIKLYRDQASVELILHDNSGKRIKAWEVKGENKIIVKEKFEPGLYVMIIKSKDQVDVEKVIIR